MVCCLPASRLPIPSSQGTLPPVCVLPGRLWQPRCLPSLWTTRHAVVCTVRSRDAGVAAEAFQVVRTGALPGPLCCSGPELHAREGWKETLLRVWQSAVLNGLVQLQRAGRRLRLGARGGSGRLTPWTRARTSPTLRLSMSPRPTRSRPLLPRCAPAHGLCRAWATGLLASKVQGPSALWCACSGMPGDAQQRGLLQL